MNRVTLNVKFWTFLPDQEHFKNQAFKLAPAFLKNFETLTQFRRSQTAFVLLQNVYVPLHVDGGGGTCNRYNLHCTNHMQIRTQHSVG